jgi:hypothetical protein
MLATNEHESTRMKPEMCFVFVRVYSRPFVLSCFSGIGEFEWL